MKIFIIILAISLASCAGIQSRYHQVEAGESLPQIAAKYQVPVSALQKYNSGALALGIKPGVKLYIPFEENPRWNDELSHDGRDLSSEPVAAEFSTASFSWPVVGFIRSGFGPRHNREHEGIDISAKMGTPVKAARSGHVIYASNGIRGYGNMVIIRHADEYSTVYAHLSKMEVKKGQFITRGQRLGRVGKTGHATGPHLHFEVRNSRVPVNPLLYLQGQYATNILNR